jgi:NAD(P)-dependent dehydrogenase (short-subunit alcohol dehydrogenase family)
MILMVIAHGAFRIPLAMKMLQDRVALVTGASRGLGKSIALELAGESATVALIGRDEARLGETAAECRRLGANAYPFTADITQEAQITALKRDVEARFGRVDILVNNAGINVRKSAVDLTPDEWRSVIDTNLTAVFLMCHAFIPMMRGRGYGRIINLGSSLSHVALPGRTAYAASKAGILGLTKALALELAGDGITVVAICPGPFVTELSAPLRDNPELNAQIMSMVPLNRWGDPRDIGKLTRFLCSDDAGYITGSDILIDGGWTAQ